MSLELNLYGFQGLEDDASPAADTAASPEELEARQAWLNVVNTLDLSVLRFRDFSAQLEAFRAQGLNTTKFEQRLGEWLDDANNLFKKLGQFLYIHSGLKDVVDLASDAWTKLLNSLGLGSSNLGELGVWPLLAEALANPAVWLALKEILLKLIFWVGGYLISSNLVSLFNGDADTVKTKSEALQSCLDAAAKATTPSEKQQILNTCDNVSATGIPTLGWLGIGAVLALGAYWYSRKQGF